MLRLLCPARRGRSGEGDAGAGAVRTHPPVPAPLRPRPWRHRRTRQRDAPAGPHHPPRSGGGNSASSGGRARAPPGPGWLLPRLPPPRAVVAAQRKGRGAGAMAAAARPLALLTSCAVGFAPEELVKRESGPPRRPGGRNQGPRLARGRGNRAGSGSLQLRPSGRLFSPQDRSSPLRAAAVPSRCQFSPQCHCRPLTVSIFPSGSLPSPHVLIFPSGSPLSPQVLIFPVEVAVLPSATQPPIPYRRCQEPPRFFKETIHRFLNAEGLKGKAKKSVCSAAGRIADYI